MQQFSSIYEKLIDMGFANDAIDAAIKKGLHTFDMIFNDLVETDADLKAYSESNNVNKYGNICQPVLKLRANPNASIFEDGIKNKFIDMTICEPSVNVAGDWRSRVPSQLQWISTSERDERSMEPNVSSINPMRRMEDKGQQRRSIINGPPMNDIGVTEAISSTISASSLSINANSDHSAGAMPAEININAITKIQVMDLLDPSLEPITFTHPFHAAISTIRDLICWFHRCRYSSNRVSKSHANQLAITSDTSLNDLIEQFQQLHWHLVMPSGAQSIRIVGEYYLDRSISSIGLYPSAHLLAIISCPSQLQRQPIRSSQLHHQPITIDDNHSNATAIETSDSCPSQLQRQPIKSSQLNHRPIKSSAIIDDDNATAIETSDSCPSQLHHQPIKSSQLHHRPIKSSAIIDDDNATAIATSDSCLVQIDIIDSSSSNIYYRIPCDPNKTTLEKIVIEFAHISQMDVGTFTLLRQEPRQMFSYPEDYLHTLTELDMNCDRVSLSCYRLDEQWPNDAVIGSSNYGNNNSGDSVQAPYIGSFSLPILQFESVRALDLELTANGITQPFSGIGIPLPGCHDNRSVGELWADRLLDIRALDINSTPRLDRRPKSLLHLCFKEIYRLLRLHSNTACRSMKKLPNNIQQIFIKFLLDDKLLTPSLLSYFCAAGSNLTCLDLSYSILATNEVLKCVSKCPTMEELILDNEEHTFSNEGLWHLRYLTRLRRLSLNYCAKINDWGIQVVGALPSLSVLAIKYTSVTNVGLKHIYLHLSSQNDPVSCVPALRSVDLSGLTISDECMTCIGMFTHLELLNLSSSHVANPLSFPRLPELRHLDISHCHKLTWETQLHVKSLCDSFPKLSSINVRGVSNANLVHVTMAISHCKFIRQLDGIFCHPQMTASLAASLSHLPLETIILTNCRHVTDLWLPVLARFSATLTHLVLSSCSGLVGDNNSILNNLSRLRNLSWLDLTHLDNVDSCQICQLLLGDHFPKLQVAWISLTDQQESEFRSQCQHLNFKINVTKSLIKQLNSGGLIG